MKEKILFIAPHSDEETMSCEATNARHVHKGADVRDNNFN